MSAPVAPPADLIGPPISKTVGGLVWNSSQGVPISDAQKQQWVKDAIRWLKANPGEPWYGIQSGDTYIRVKREDSFYLVEEFTPKQHAYLERDPDEKSNCSCSNDILVTTGCQCGGI
jgi:hypothetical protein